MNPWWLVLYGVLFAIFGLILYSFRKQIETFLHSLSEEAEEESLSAQIIQLHRKVFADPQKDIDDVLVYMRLPGPLQVTMRDMLSYFAYSLGILNPRFPIPASDQANVLERLAKPDLHDRWIATITSLAYEVLQFVDGPPPPHEIQIANLLPNRQGLQTAYTKAFDTLRRHVGIHRPDEETRNPHIAKLVNLPQPVHLTNKIRFEHQVVFGRTGSGKSTLLSYFMSKDLEAVAAGAASMVIFDTGRKLYRSMSRLKRFAPGGDLDGRLLTIDFDDVLHPVAISLFEPIPEKLTDAARREVYNAAIFMIEHIFTNLFNFDASDRMSTMLANCTDLLLATPGSSIDDFFELMKPNGIKNYRSSLNRVDHRTRDFFLHRFDNKEDTFLRHTKLHVLARFDKLAKSPLMPILNAKKTLLDLGDQLSKGRVILINMPESLLTKPGVETVGRFFLAALVRAMTQRSAVLNSDDLMPTFVYIDEAQQIIKDDTSVETLLMEARKYKIGLILATLQPDRLMPGVLKTVLGMSGIIMSGRVLAADAALLSKQMNTSVDFILNQPDHAFATYVDRLFLHAQSYKVPKEVDFGTELKMEDHEAETIRNRMRRDYCTAISSPLPTPTDPAPAETSRKTPTEPPKKSATW